MVASHPELASRPQYHSLVGSYLSSEIADVEKVDGSRNARGVRWLNRLSKSESVCDWTMSSAPIATAEAYPMHDSLGPQHAGDDPFTARLRRHMSWYRTRVLRVPCGVGPRAKSIARYGNMLAEADAARGLNFLTPEIHEVARARVREGKAAIDEYRLFHNLLSSQPMCFNLFGPLVQDRVLATTLLQALPEFEVARVLAVKLEFAPVPRDEYLGDRTAFDAFIDYERRDGSRAFLGIETKLTDKFSRKEYDTPSYRRWMVGQRSPFHADAGAQAARMAHNQLWRDHLLAIAMRDHARSPYQRGTFVLVRHPEDRGCESIVQAYQTLLVAGDTTFVDLPLSRLLDCWQSVAIEASRRNWLQSFRERYLDLHESEAAR
jgi:hypothetical protein